MERRTQAQTGNVQPMTISQVVYASRPFGFDELTLAGILVVARRNNLRDGITGALICREDLYLQLLEGPHQAVAAAFERILRDGRHSDVVPLLSCDAEARLFPGWAMRDDPAKSWMWTPEQVRAGAVAAASPDEVRGVFLRLLSEPLSRAG